MEQGNNSAIISNYPRGVEPALINRVALKRLLAARPDIWWVSVFSIKACIFLVRGTFGSDRNFLWLFSICLHITGFWGVKGVLVLADIERFSKGRRLLVAFAWLIFNSLGLGYVAATWTIKRIERILAASGLDESVISLPKYQWDTALDQWEQDQSSTGSLIVATTSQ